MILEENNSKNSFQKFHVVLLKTNDHHSNSDNPNGHSDRYVEYLRAQSLPQLARIDKINLLCFDFINKQVLINKILHLYSDYASLILTSRQTVEAIEASLDAISKSKELMESIHGDSYKQKKITVYCVGEATATRFKSFLAKVENTVIGKCFFNAERFIIKQSGLKKSDSNGVDDHKQNSRELARLLVEDFKGLSQNEVSTFAFYPCSSIRKDDLSTELKRENVTFDELHVYQTTHSEAGLVNLANLIKYALEVGQEIICLVVFSPSCANAIFKKNLELKSLILSNLSRFKFVSVGPSTSSELGKDVGHIFELKEPSPEALREAFL